MKNATFSLSQLLLVVFSIMTPLSHGYGQIKKSPVTIIEGHLFGHDGKPVALSAVGIGYPNAPQFKIIDVEQKGTFRLSTERTGLLIIDFSAPNHEPQQVALYIERPKHVKLDVGLTALKPKEDLSNILLNDATDTTFRIIDRKRMQRHEDGTYSLSFETDRKLIGYTVSGTKPFDYFLCGTGDEKIKRTSSFSFLAGHHPVYYSVATPLNGQVSIKLSPSRYPKGTQKCYVKFGAQNREDKVFNSLYQVMQQRGLARLALRLEDREANHNIQGYKEKDTLAPASELQRLISLRLKKEKNKLNRQLLLLNYLALDAESGVPGKDLALQALKELSPRSPLWWIKPELLNSAVAAIGNEKGYKEYSIQVVKNLPDKSSEPKILTNLIMSAEEAKLSSISDAIIDVLVERHPTSGSTKHILSMYRNNIIVVGQKVPDFRAHSLNDTSVAYTPETFKGKVYIIDFWATWCTPCITDMPYLTQAYDKFHARGFEILSYSLDKNREVVENFRKTRFSMPWLQSIDPALKAGEGEFAKNFGIFSLPRVLLVDQEGIIVAVDRALEKEKLESSILKVLESAK